MDKVVTDIGRHNRIYLPTTHVLYLHKKLMYEELRQIVDWCNKNLADNVLIGTYNKSRFDGIEDCLFYLNHHWWLHPKLSFIEESDMVAFKLRWSELVYKVSKEYMTGKDLIDG